ncbi:MAG TPA: ABC transporter ATP-binding protein [Gemmatimonadota bacterium]|jgi:ABC-2 type transport system ATP-binding protein|nr:ABC transporter ATP-binding protein [Gemmatimonadota bacterium]
MPAIETLDLTRRFDGLTAVDDLSITVERGEIVGLLGPNGAGKTTTIRMLAALIPSTSGTARVAGHRLGEEDDQVRRSVGILTETPGLYDRLSARRNLELHARLQGVDDVASTVNRYLDLLGLADRADDLAGTFSKGMRQKLALARALLHEPEILLLDEPTAGLDPHVARVVRDSIASLRREGRTILLSTHNLEEAERLCDRVAMIQGRLVAFDRPADLRERLLSPRVRVRLTEMDHGAAAARALPFVRAVTEEGGSLTVTLAEADDAPDLVRGLVEAGARVHEVVAVRPSLEEVYLEIMTAEPPSAPGPVGRGR